MKTILKRDGSRAAFAAYKIEDAIIKAFESVGQPYDKSVFSYVRTRVEAEDLVSVEEIQDAIEKALFNLSYFSVMRSFMLYRHTHKMQREHILGLNEDTTYIDSTQSVEEYIGGGDWRINANANTGYSEKPKSSSFSPSKTSRR